jgi:hypothetical protein
MAKAAWIHATCCGRSLEGGGVLGPLDQPRQDGIGVDLKHPGPGTHAPAFRQCAHRPHALRGRHALAMQRGARGFLEVAAPAHAMPLSPGTAVGMTVGTDMAQPAPAARAPGGSGTAMARGVHLAVASACGDDGGWRGAGGLRARRSGVRTRVTMGLVGEARKGLRDTGGWRGGGRGWGSL